MLPFHVPRLSPTGLVGSGLNVVSWAVILPAPATVKLYAVAPFSVSVPANVLTTVVSAGGAATVSVLLQPLTKSDNATRVTRQGNNRCMCVLNPTSEGSTDREAELERFLW